MEAAEKRYTEVDWRAYSEIANMARIHILSLNQGFTCLYMQRVFNQQAHHIANMARIHIFYYQGYTYPLFVAEGFNSISYQ